MHKALGTNRALPITIALLAIMGLLPARYIAWTDVFGGLARRVVWPVSHPFHLVANWLTPRAPHQADDATVRALREEKELLTTQLLRVREENARLYRQLEELHHLSRLNPDTPVQHVTAPVIGGSSDLSSGILTVRAGQRQGVERNTVVVATGLQLVGRVIDAGARTAIVQPMTARGAGKIRGRVMFEPLDERLICILEAVGDGTLRGDTGDPTPGKALNPVVGQLVRLDDLERWPEHAQMLVIGKIEKVEPSPSNPLRPVITVRPTLAIERVSEVVLRIAAEPAEVSPPAKGGP